MSFRFAFAGVATGLLLATGAGAAPLITMTAISTVFATPIGIDYYEPTNSIVMSANYSSGIPNNLIVIAQNGSHTNYSTLAGLTDELKIASVRSGYTTGFAVGTIFTGNGSDGQIVKVDPGGGSFTNPWVSLPGANNGLVRGSLYVDRTGLYNGDLIAVTTGGELWRIDAAGASTKIDDQNVHLEGLSIVPNLPKWGPYAGCIVAGAENQGLMHFWCPSTTAPNGFSHSSISVGVNIEDIDVIDGGNFFGVNFGTSRVLGAAASQFSGMTDDLLLTQENPSGGGTGLYRMRYDGTNLVTEQFAQSGGAPIGQWEHVTFAPAGIVEIPPTGVPTPGTMSLLGLGLLLLAGGSWRHRAGNSLSVRS